MNNSVFKKIAVSVMVLLTVVVSAGTNEQMQVLPRASIVPGAILQTQGNRYASSQNPVTSRNYFTQRAYGLVKLYSPNLYQTTVTGSASITVKIDYQKEEGGAFVLYSVTQTLTLNSDAAKVIDAAYYKAEGAELVKVEVLNVNIPSVWSAIDFKLEASVVTESFDYLNFSAISGVNLRHNSPLTTAGNLKVLWKPLPGAEAYDLEWTYVSNQSSNPIVVLPANDIEVDRFLFRNNSSRVEVTDTMYEIPLMYEKGYIIYRLRASGKRLANGVAVKTITEWTAPDGNYGTVGQYPTGNVFLYDGLENNINWQASLTFAEEGKHKAVLAYHDGSMRNRQAVTRINTDQRSVVGETFYDYNGKPVIQVLPVPVTQNELLYYPNFNLIQGETKVKKETYSIMTQGEGCVAVSPDFSTATGASQYYSPQNNFVGSATNNTGNQMINRDLLPDANKKPYTQTKYTPDNTGKIAAQSGVGAAHIIGSDHETKYLYGTPQQEELTRLFGNQVGYNVHYKKDLTIDPNGQVSVTYKNMGDKVVATTIVGNSPTNLTELEGDKTKEVKSELLGVNGSANVLSNNGKSKNYLSKFTVAADNDYTFDYSGILGSYDLSCINTSEPYHLSLDGAVDLTIRLIDGCGSVVFADQRNTNSGNTGASQTMTVKHEDVNLKQGEYVLSKELSINEEKLEQYWQDYLRSDNNCFKDTLSFITEERAKIDLTGCELTCEKCEVEIQKMLTGTNNYSDEERFQISKLCDAICDRGIGCSSYLNAMLGDMSPGGQYAELRKSKLNIQQQQSPEFDSNNQPAIQPASVNFNSTDADGGDAGNPDDNNIDTTSFPLSIFNYSNSLPIIRTIPHPIPVSIASWRAPLQITVPGFVADNRKNQVLSANISLATASYQITDYKDGNGDIVYAYVFRDENAPTEFKPRIIDTTNLILVSEATQLYKVPIRFLANVADFEKYWQPHFANYLLPYHPEYGYYIDCSHNYIASNDFDYVINKTATYEEASGKEFLSSADVPQIIGSTQVSSMDPFLKLDIRNYKYMNFRDTMYSGGKSMSELATVSANCPRGDQAGNCGSVAANCGDGLIDTDVEWNIYKGLYLSEKQKLLKVSATKRAVVGRYYNGCIGEPDFYSMPEAQYFRERRDHIVRLDTTRECHLNWTTFFHNRWECEDVIRPYNAVIAPYIDPRQVCFNGRVNLFEKKTKRFFINVSANSAAGQMPMECEHKYADATDTIIVPAPCDSAIIGTLNEITYEAQRYKFESCGLCPFASEVENFLINLHNNKFLESSYKTRLTCASDTVQLGQQLFRQLSDLTPQNSDISWTSTVTSNAADNSKILEGHFVSGTNTIATLRLTIPPHTVPSYVQFDSLSRFCCMSITKGVTGPNAGKLFTMDATYESLNKTKVNFTVYGYFDLRVDTCTITPRCMTTKDAKRVLNFLNMLAISGVSKNSELVTNGSNMELLNGPFTRDDIYMNAVRSLIKKDNELEYNGYAPDDTMRVYHPVWNATGLGSELQGVLTYVERGDTSNVVIELSGLASGAYHLVKEFTRLRPFPGDSSKFYVDALMHNGGQPSANVYVPIVVEVPSMKTTVCEEIKPPVMD